MLTDLEARIALKKVLPDWPIKAWIRYRDVYLFRIEFPSEAEKDFDPFFSVNAETGEVRDFSVLTDGDIGEITQLFLNEGRR